MDRERTSAKQLEDVGSTQKITTEFATEFIVMMVKQRGKPVLTERAGCDRSLSEAVSESQITGRHALPTNQLQSESMTYESICSSCRQDSCSAMSANE